MIDDGSPINICEHGDSRRYCITCLRIEVERLREENTNLRESVESLESLVALANKQRDEANARFATAIGTTREVTKEVKRLRDRVAELEASE